MTADSTTPDAESRRARRQGLSVALATSAYGVSFGALAVAAGLDALRVEFPVVIDAERELWQSYGCEGWPSLFLWSLGGALAFQQVPSGGEFTLILAAPSVVGAQGGCDAFYSCRVGRNVYINDEDVRFSGGLAAPTADGDVIVVLPAVSGGAF